MLRHLFLHGKSLIKLALLKFASFSSKIHASERHQADKNKRNLLTGTREKEKDYFRHVASSALRHSSASAMSVDSTPKSKVKHPRVLAALYTLVVTAVIPSGKETYVRPRLLDITRVRHGKFVDQRVSRSWRTAFPRLTSRERHATAPSRHAPHRRQMFLLT